MVTLVGLILLSGCSTEDPGPEAETGPWMDGEWVERHTRVRVLDRMFHEQEPVEVYERLNKDDQEALTAAGIVVKEKGVYTVQTDPEQWDTDAIQWSGMIDGPLELLMRRNDITWCGEPHRASGPVFDYVNRAEDAFETTVEYYESIDDFVDCGDGGV